MVQTLENAWLQLRVHPASSRWDVISREHDGLKLLDVQVGILYRHGFSQHHALDQWHSPDISLTPAVSSPFGPLNQLTMAFGCERHGLKYLLTFALSEKHPFLLWKIAIENRGHHPVNIDRIDLLSVGFIYKGRKGSPGSLHFGTAGKTNGERKAAPSLREIAFFSNGWQSWSYAGVYGPLDRFRRTHLGFLRAPASANAGTPQPKRAGLFASDMFAVIGDRNQRKGVLLGFLSQVQHFGSLEAWVGGLTPALRMWANGDGVRLGAGGQMVTDWACLYFLHLDDPDALGLYLEAVAHVHGLPSIFSALGSNDDSQGTTRSTTSPVPLKSIPTGWCSWYQFSEDYFGRVTAQDIRTNLVALAGLNSRLPLEVVQIDDGFESQVGDWYHFKPGFPEGVAPLAAEIRKAGFRAGLWLAPFIVHPKSRLAGEHPDWLLRNSLGRPVNAGYLWGNFATALDLTHPEALAYASEVIHTAVHRWGFDYLKLDFLYAAALPGRHRDLTKTRAQILRTALETVRTAAGQDAFLLGCGCPLGATIGVVDAMRIGADVAPTWQPTYKIAPFLFKREPDFPSAENAIHNALTRSPLHRRWWINDPDCLLLRPTTQLTLDEVQALATVIVLSGGTLLISDHIPDLPEDRLRIAEVLLPLIGERPHLLDWFDSTTPSRIQVDLEGAIGTWHLLALFNWKDTSQNLTLRLSDFYLDSQVEYWAREFWRGEVARISQRSAPRGQLTFKDVSPHGVVLLAVRLCRAYQPQYLGGDLHISQGLEVVGWQWQGEGSAAAGKGLQFTLQRPGEAHGQVDLALPHSPREITINQQPVAWQTIQEGVYRIGVSFVHTATVECRF